MDIAGVGKLHQATLHQQFGGFGEGLENHRIDVVGKDGQRLRDQVIPDQNTGIATPFGIDGLPSAADGGFVHHVVVQEGGGMDVLDHATVLDDHLVQLQAAQAGTDQQEQRTDPLAPRVQDILPYSGNDRDVREKIIPQRLFDPLQVGFEELRNLFIIHSRTLHRWLSHGYSNTGPIGTATRVGNILNSTTFGSQNCY